MKGYEEEDSPLGDVQGSGTMWDRSGEMLWLMRSCILARMFSRESTIVTLGKHPTTPTRQRIEV
jgi:hypothetical protein